MIKVYLLGALQIEVPQEKSPQIRRKTRAFLAYLSAAGRAIPRQQLLDMFCADAKNPSTVLRLLVSRARKHLGFGGIQIDQDQYSLGSNIWVDIDEFAATVQDPTSLELLLQTLSLFRDDFISDIQLKEAPEFEMWVLGQRAKYRALLERGLEKAINLLIEQSRFDEAIVSAQKLIASNSLLEAAHAQLIWLYAQIGNLAAARQQYQRIESLLHDELAVEPTPELQSLIRDIESGKIRPQISISVEAVDPMDRPNDVVFVGREAELSGLTQSWQEAINGHGGVVILEGEAGAGKSHLIDRFRSVVGSSRFFRGEGYESAQAIPFAPWLELLEKMLFSTAEEDLQQQSDVVKRALSQLMPGVGIETEETIKDLPTNHLFAAVSTFLMSESRCLVIDNLQWSDTSTLQLFHFLARRAASHSVLLIGLTRPAVNHPPLARLIDDLARQNARFVSLLPFDLDQSNQLIEQLWPNLAVGLQNEAAARLFEATQGNPLFLAELIRELDQFETIPDVLPVPASIRDLIQRRVRRLNQATQQVVESLAVLHAPATPEIIRQISGRSEEETVFAFERAAQSGLISEQQDLEKPYQYDFYHDLVRQAVNHQISTVRRRLLHKRAAQALKPTVSPAVLAYHWREAGDTKEEAAAALQAGKQSERLSALAEASEYYERVLVISDQPREKLDAKISLAFIALHRSDRSTAHAIFKEVLADATAAGDKDHEARSLVAIGRIEKMLGNYEKSSAILEKALSLARRHQVSKAESEALAEIGLLAYLQGDHEHALESLKQSQTIAEREGDGFRASIAIANQGIVHWAMGDLETAITYYQRKLAFDQAVGDRLSMSKAYGNIGIAYSRLGNDEFAFANALKKVEIDHELGDSEGVARGLIGLANVYNRHGDGQAGQCYLLALEKSLLFKDKLLISNIAASLMWFYANQDQTDLADMLLEPALELGRLVRSPMFLCQVNAYAAKIKFRQGKVQEALELVQEAIPLAKESRQSDTELDLILLKLQIDQNLGQDIAIADEFFSLLQLFTSKEQQARAMFTRWLMEPNEENAASALQINRAVFELNGRIEFREYFQEISGDRLPLGLTLPKLPPFLADPTPDLNELHGQLVLFSNEQGPQ